MKSRKALILNLLVVLGLLLGACGPAATPTAAPAALTAMPVEPTAVPEVVEPLVAGEAELDAAFNAFLANMQSFNALGMEPFIEMLAEDPAPFLLDVRQMEEVEANGHIPGAVLIPLRELGQHLDMLPSFDTPIVSYCGSGWRCTIAMTELGALGWQNVLSLKGNSFGGYAEGGFPVEPGLPAEAQALNGAIPDQALWTLVDETLAGIPEGWGAVKVDNLATELVENPDLILIDVRTPAEIEADGSIEAENALAIPLADLVAQRAQWPADKSAPIVVYCGSGHRSTIAMSILWTYGYENVRSMQGGFSTWLDAGYPRLGGAPDFDGAFNAFLADMVSFNTISLSDLNGMLAEEPPPFLLDVRTVAEVEENGHIEGSVLIPLVDLMKNLDKLPGFDTTIVAYCGSGWRCTIAMPALEALGWTNVLALKGGSFGGWAAEGYPVVEGLPLEAESLNAASLDPAMVAQLDAVFSGIPAGYGGIAPADLAAELAENPELILIDVRTPEEVAEVGVIEAETWIGIPLVEFINQMADWPADKDAQIVVYCGSGHRSTIAMSILWTYGFSDVRSMQGGVGAWLEAGYPVVELVAE